MKGKGHMDTFIWSPEDEPGGTMPPDVAAAVASAKVQEVRACIVVHTTI